MMPFDGPPEWAPFFELVATLGGEVGSIRADVFDRCAPAGRRMACATFNDDAALRYFVEAFDIMIKRRRDLHPLQDDIGAGFATIMHGRHVVYWPRVTGNGTVQ